MGKESLSDGIQRLGAASIAAIEEVKDAAVEAIGNVKREKEVVERQRDQLLAALRTCDEGLAHLDQDKFGAMRLMIGRAIAAVEQPAAAPDADSWIKWYGGDCPVSPDVFVEVILRGFPGKTVKRQANQFSWVHVSHAGVQSEFDIIAYRVVQEGGAA